MARIKIPEQVFPGFQIIGKLSDQQIDTLSKHLLDIVGRDYAGVAQELSDQLAISGDELLQAILSFNKLMGDENVDVADLANNLAESYKDVSEQKFNDQEFTQLQANLLSILSNYNGIKLNQKIRNYKLENANQLNDFKVFTDLRIIDKDNEDRETYAIILHKIYMNFENDEKGIHIHTDFETLVQLKEEIDNALDRHKIIRESDVGNLKLIQS